MTDIKTDYNNSEVNSNSQEFKKKLYAIDLPKFEKQISTSYLNSNELECITVNNGIILPLRKTELPATDAIYEGGVCDESFKFIAGHKRIDNKKSNNYEIIRSYKPSSLEYSNEEVIYAGIAYSHFGHFLLESLNRLWWIIKNRKFNIKVVFLKNRPFDASFLDLLQLIGLKKENIIFLEKPTKFKKVIVPQQSLCFYSYYHKEFLLPYNVISEKIIPTEYKKVYFSRTQFIKKDLINEEYFEDFYRSMGYQVVYPEQLDIKEQIALAAGADQIVSAIGSVSHLALFAKKGVKVISLLRARTFVTTVQIIINQAKDLDYTFIDVTCNFLPSRYSSPCFYIGPNENWIDFVKQEYGTELETDLFDYMNSQSTHIGDYFKQWIKTFSSKKQLGKIQNDNALDLLKNLKTIFSDEEVGLELEKITEGLSIKPNKSSRFSGKSFQFSRYDGSYSRQILLNESGLIETVSGKDNKNETFWEVVDNELNFLDIDNKLTSRYFCTKEKNGELFLLGYYQPNKEIIFRLEEIKTTGLRTAKKTKI